MKLSEEEFNKLKWTQIPAEDLETILKGKTIIRAEKTGPSRAVDDGVTLYFEDEGLTLVDITNPYLDDDIIHVYIAKANKKG